MARDSVIIRMLKGNYSALGLQIDSTYKKADLLLRLYRKVSWSVSDSLEDLTVCSCESSDNIVEALSCLLEFVPEKDMETFRSKALAALQTKALVELIETSVAKLRDYPDNGHVYYSILELKYLNFFRFTEDEILEQLDMERSTYYRKKKEATMLLGYILFGLVMPEFVKNEKVSNICD